MRDAPLEGSHAWCDALSEFFSYKIKDIYNFFPPPVSTVNPLSMENSVPDEHALKEIPFMVMDTLLNICALVKSISPCDRAAPQFLSKAEEVVLPVLLKMINSSILTGLVPPLWKHALVKALLKKPNADRDILGNYRPTSLLPGFSKMLEKHVDSAISTFFESHNILHSLQTVFCRQHGTETALLALLKSPK